MDPKRETSTDTTTDDTRDPGTQGADEATLESVIEGAIAPQEDEQRPDQGAEGAGEGGGEKAAENASDASSGDGRDEPEGEPAPEGKADADGKGDEAPESGDGKAGKAEEDDDEDEEAFLASLSERAQKRFKALTERVRQAEEQLGAWREVLESTGANDQELAALIEYARLIHSPNREDKRRALEMIEREREALARELGEALPGVDPLAEHPDLKKRVEAMELGMDDALAIARARRLERELAEQQERQQMTAREQAEMEAAIGQLNALGAELEQRDPDYRRKIEILSAEQIPWIKANLPPRLWPEAVRVAYEQLSRAMEHAAAAAAPKPDPQRQPLRATPGAGGAQKVPTTMEQAIAQALGESAE